MFKEFEKIIGYESVKKDLELICDIVKNYEKYEKLGVKFPGGLLLDGDPGVGKTSMANCFIEATGLKSFVCRKNKADGKFVDEIKRVFDEAKKMAPSIVFLDDMDKFANEDKFHRDAEEYVTVQSCIDEIKGKRVFVIATINDSYKIPDSLKRAGRFDKVIYVETPSGEDARKIVEHYLSKFPNVGEVNTNDVAHLLDGNSCAVLETVINKAGMYAGFFDKEKIDMNDIVQAFLDVNYNVDKGEIKNTKEARSVAVHEAGHVVIAELLFPGSVNLAVLENMSVNAKRKAFVSRANLDMDINPFEKREHEAMVNLAGKAATEVILNIVDVGCNKDLNQAFYVAETYVDHFCAIGFDAFIRDDSGTDVANRKDYLIAKRMEKYYEDTKKLIRNNKVFVEGVAEKLLEKRILLRTDIDEIKAELKLDEVNK